jgi:nucleoside-diphosphate-sugar epimerase
MQKQALIVGVSGVIGQALAEQLLGHGWKVYGLSRGRTPIPAGCSPLVADLTAQDSVIKTLQNITVDCVFLSVWSRQKNEQENIRVNGAMVSYVINALGERLRGRHVALVTGLKHYLGPFDAYGKGAVPMTPFREEQGRQPVDNFYYAQEDAVFAGSAQFGFTWSVHRPHTIIGFAVGNAMNMGQTLAVYATLCKHNGHPFVFPGSPQQWHGISDMTDANLLAQQLEWAATSPAAKNQDFNAVNGDVFRWQWMWQQIADYFGIEPAPYPGKAQPLADRMDFAPAQWRNIAERYQLNETDITKLVSWWHTDADLGRPMEVFTDMSKSRKAGFTGYQCTSDAFFRLFDKLKTEKLIPDSDD